MGEPHDQRTKSIPQVPSSDTQPQEIQIVANRAPKSSSDRYILGEETEWR